MKTILKIRDNKMTTKNMLELTQEELQAIQDNLLSKTSSRLNLMYSTIVKLAIMEEENEINKNNLKLYAQMISQAIIYKKLFNN